MDNQKKLSREKRDKAEKEMKEIEDRKKKMLVD